MGYAVKNDNTAFRAVRCASDCMADEYYSEEAPVLSQSADDNISLIKARLMEIDLKSVRPLRAIASGEATADDTAKLDSLASEAAALRQQLSDLTTQAS